MLYLSAVLLSLLNMMFNTIFTSSWDIIQANGLLMWTKEIWRLSNKLIIRSQRNKKKAEEEKEWGLEKSATL
jgi:hypothetical protein